ncbi:four helix bundle protein [Sporosarcina trichiuri]|uniref:four helix bundle protein n=1 Tax=Sporosarcina trichiuri TaxID=3056445 RepID=UPI0025B32357|nr:four helix bundle protein [Sporosarcina sp. 0.2-SM1T-5]WJY27489.1 four helix bundle protein [Sporosarcina sp. 0.2-SM1T-5]
MIRGKRDRTPGDMAVCAKTKDLIRYTMQITNNPQRFSKRVRFTLTNRLQEKVLLMYEQLIEANELYPETAADFRERRRLQRKTLALCKQVAFLIELSLDQKRIEDRQASHWAGLVHDVQSLTAKWMQSDYRRFSELG